MDKPTLTCSREGETQKPRWSSATESNEPGTGDFRAKISELRWSWGQSKDRWGAGGSHPGPQTQVSISSSPLWGRGHVMLGKRKEAWRVWNRTENLGGKRWECFRPIWAIFKMLHKYYSNAACGKHLCSKPVYLKKKKKSTCSEQQFYFLKIRHLLPEVTSPAVQRQPSDPTAESTWTMRQNDPVGAAGLHGAPLRIALAALSCCSQSVSSIYWALVLRAVGSPGNEVSPPLHKCIRATPSQM